MPDDEIQTIRVVLPEIKVVKIDVSSIGIGVGAYLSSNTARVDPSGDDSTGVVGDLTKPFKTSQAAVDALALATPAAPVLDIGNNTVSGFNTALPFLTVVGAFFNPENFTGATINGSINCIFDNSSDSTFLSLRNVRVASDITFTNTGNDVFLLVQQATVSGTVSSTASGITIVGRSAGGNSNLADRLEGTILCAPGYAVAATNVFLGTIGTPDKNIAVLLSNFSYATSVNADTLTISDSGVVANGINANTVIRQDILLNPALMDFSTLPQATSEPAIAVGAAWIDTTGGLNIVKVKL